MKRRLKKDPTRTTLLRRKFVSEMNKRFRGLRRDIRHIIIDTAVLGSTSPKPLKLNVGEWQFLSDSAKVTAFQAWFKSQVDAGILEVEGVSATPWTNKYVYSAYRKGTVRAYIDTRKGPGTKSADFLSGGQSQFMSSAFAGPIAVSSLELLYTRTFSELKGVTAQMEQQMGRVLADGLVHGYSMEKVARNLSDAVDKMNRTRARLIARTEIIRAHAEGQLDGLEALGVSKVEKEVELSTAGDERVCATCEGLEGETYTIDEARGVIPLHPLCRCSWIPVI